MMIAMIPAAGWLALFTVYLRGLAGTFTFEDGPELLACAATLGNSHEPGYPLLCLLNRLALTLPVGTNAFRQNLLAAAAAAGAAVLAGALAGSVLRRIATMPGLPAIGGLFTAVLWGLSDAFWWQAGIGDKYPLLCLLFVAVLWTAWRGRMGTTALLFGLAITQHPFGLFAAPAFGWVMWKSKRPAPLLLLLVALPLSLRFIYPPVRAVSEMNWGDPVTVTKLGRSLTSGRYHAAVGEAGADWRAGAVLGGRLLVEELMVPALAAAGAGAVVFARRVPAFAGVLAACAALNVALALWTPEKVVRWYAPVYALAAVLAGIGWAALAGSVRGSSRIALLAAGSGVLAIAGWQGSRGWHRSDHSCFYAAHDMARNILASIPPGAVYLGRGDDDLFPLWAGRFGEGLRPDVEAVGMGTIVDERPADAGGVRRLSGRVGFRLDGWDHLRWLLTSPRGIPVRYARTGFDDVLWRTCRLDSQRASGLTAEWAGTFDPAGSRSATRRTLRAYRWRGLRTAAAGATLDGRRPRDEVARDALLQPVYALATLGIQCADAGADAAALDMFSRSVVLLEPFVGPLPRSVTRSSSRESVAIGFDRLAAIWDRRGVRPVAARFRTIAAGFRTPLRP